MLARPCLGFSDEVIVAQEAAAHGEYVLRGQEGWGGRGHSGTMFLPRCRQEGLSGSDLEQRLVS